MNKLRLLSALVAGFCMSHFVAFAAEAGTGVRITAIPGWDIFDRAIRLRASRARSATGYRS